MEGKKRINWLLILQGWAMLWVVIGHAPVGDAENRAEWVKWLYNFAYSFHMPLFMLVSGWLFYLTRLKVIEGTSWSFGQIVKDKIKRLLLPGVVFSIIAFVVKIAFPGFMSRQLGLNFYDILHAYLYPYDNPLRELWFIVTLFWLMLLVPIWQLVLKKKWRIWGALIFLVIFHFWHPDIKLLCIGRVFIYGIWFCLGLVMSKTNVVDKLLEKQPLLTLFVGVLLYIIGLFTDERFITTLGGIVLSFGLALILEFLMPQAFFSFRNYTYQIFLLGIFAQIVVKIIYRYVTMPYFVAFIICLLSGLYVPVIVAKIVEKINWKPLSLCYGLKV